MPLRHCYRASIAIFTMVIAPWCACPMLVGRGKRLCTCSMYMWCGAVVTHSFNVSSPPVSSHVNASSMWVPHTGGLGLHLRREPPPNYCSPISTTSNCSTSFTLYTASTFLHTRISFICAACSVIQCSVDDMPQSQLFISATHATAQAMYNNHTIPILVFLCKT